MQNPPALRQLRRIIVRENDRMRIVALEEIDWIESADNYALLRVGRTTHVVRETLTALEARCAPASFVRISRGAMVNAARVREIHHGPDGHEMLLAGGHRLPITRGTHPSFSRQSSRWLVTLVRP
jgi:two-component system LytT family response regulator